MGTHDDCFKLLESWGMSELRTRKLIRVIDGQPCIAFRCKSMSVFASIDDNDRKCSKVNITMCTHGDKFIHMSGVIDGIMSPLSPEPNSWFVVYPDGFQIVNPLQFEKHFRTFFKVYHDSIIQSRQLPQNA